MSRFYKHVLLDHAFYLRICPENKARNCPLCHISQSAGFAAFRCPLQPKATQEKNKFKNKKQMSKIKTLQIAKSEVSGGHTTVSFDLVPVAPTSTTEERIGKKPDAELKARRISRAPQYCPSVS